MQAGCEARRGMPRRWLWMNWPERYSQRGTYSKEVIVVIGGLVSSTLLTLVVLPTLYRFFERAERAE